MRISPRFKITLRAWNKLFFRSILIEQILVIIGTDNGLMRSPALRPFTGHLQAYYYSDVTWTLRHLKSPVNDCLFNSLLGLTLKNTESSALLLLSEEKPSVPMDSLYYGPLWGETTIRHHVHRWDRQQQSKRIQCKISTRNLKWLHYRFSPLAALEVVYLT